MSTPLGEFDKSFAKVNDEQKIGYFLVLVTLEFVMMMPFQQVRTSVRYLAIPVILSAVAAYCRILPYMRIGEEDKAVSIGKKLWCVPIAGKTIRRERIRQLLIYIAKTSGVALLFQFMMSGLFRGEFTIWNLCYVVTVMCAVPLAEGLVLIYRDR